jgi:DNA-binding SARP family transcriptional activator/DNA polymerase III delta prime subunit
VEFRILGPLEVIDDGGAGVAIGGNRERAVLALLLLSANRVVSSEALAHDLWGEHPPEGPAHALRVHISRLRKALREGGGDGIVITRSPGYVVRIDPMDVDAVRFESLVEQAREQAAAGQQEQAATTLRTALGLWRGPALADVADAPLARAEAARLEEARLAALEDRVEADLACGRHTQLVAELDALTRAHPLRERLWGHRMVALYRAGRQAEALRAYQDLRTILGEELGLEPDRALQRLESAILRHEPELDWPPATPVATVAVEWARPGAHDEDAGGGSVGEPLPALPMPALLTEMGRLFVGRDTELKQLERLWAEVEEGQLRLALLSGEPGVGKTRLAGELARMLHSEGSTVLVGRCDEDLGVPYQPFVEALHHFVEHTPATLLGRRLGRGAGELVRIYPDLADRLRGLAPPLRSDPETERYRLFEAVAAWLATASSDQPMLLVLDDLQWATKPTLLLLRHVMRSAGPRHLLVLGIYRDTELSHDHPLTELLADFRRQQGSERVALSGLDEADVIRFMTRAAGHELDNDGLTLARVIHSETDGNPFFVREIIRHLTETGGIEQRDGRWGSPLPVDELVVPEGIREVVGRRLSRLSADTGHALRVAAVAGPEFDLAVVGAAAELDEERVLCAVEEAIATRLVVEVPGPVPRHRFTHALVRGTLYGDLSAARRATLHRKVAVAIEAVHPGRDERLPALAYHWARAAAPTAESDRAVDYATRAGDHALALLAHDEAADYYASALELLEATGADGDDSRRLELLISRGNAQRQAGDYGYRQTLIEAAELAQRVGDVPALARAALGNTTGHMWTGAFQVDTARIEVLEAAITAVGRTDLPVRARLLATLGLELAWSPDPARRIALSEEALAIARSLEDLATLAHVLLARDYTIHSPENLSERFAATTELLEIAEHLHDPVLASRALSLRFKAAMELADVAEAESCVSRNEELVPDLGQRTLTWAARQHRATLLVLRGDAQAEAAVDGSAELAPAGLGWFFSAAHRYALRLAQGDLEETARSVSSVAEQTKNAYPKAIHAHCLAEMGHIEAAASLFDEAAASDFAYPTNNVAWLDYGAESAWLCWRLDRADYVPRIRSWLAPYAEQLVVGGFASMVIGSVAMYLGLICTTAGDWAAADSYFAEAAATHERIDAPIWLAQTRVDWARMLLSRNAPGDSKRADELLNHALTTAVKLALAAIERDARSLLAQ